VFEDRFVYQEDTNIFNGYLNDSMGGEVFDKETVDAAFT